MSAYYWIRVCSTTSEHTVEFLNDGIPADRLPIVIGHLEEKYRNELQANRLRIIIMVGF